MHNCVCCDNDGTVVLMDAVFILLNTVLLVVLAGRLVLLPVNAFHCVLLALAFLSVISALME